MNKIKVKGKRRFTWELLLLFALLFFGIYSAFLIYSTTAGHKYIPDKHLSLLADRFLQWKVSIDPINRPEGDIVDYKANLYLFFGPFSSLVLAPFVFFWGKEFPQIALGAVSLLGSFLAVYKIAERSEFEEKDSFWLALFFCFSTVMLGVSVVNFSAYQVQALGAALVLASIAEWRGKRRYWLVGVLVGLAGLTRVVLYISLVYYLGEWLRQRESGKKLLLFLLPVIFSLLLLGAYNQRRFGSFLESGYQHNVTIHTYPMEENIKYGFLSLRHVPANLYLLLFKSPEAVLQEGGGFVLKFPFINVDPWGLAIWFSSPLFFLLFRAKRGDDFAAAGSVVFLLLLPSLLYFGLGYSQFGYRYALDFLPFLLLLLLPNLSGRLDSLSKFLIILGIFFNCFYLTGLWQIYPHIFREYVRGRWIGRFF